MPLPLAISMFMSYTVTFEKLKTLKIKMSLPVRYKIIFKLNLKKSGS